MHFFGWKIDQRSHYFEQLWLFRELDNFNIVVSTCLSSFTDHLPIHDDVGPMLWHCIKKNLLGLMFAGRTSFAVRIA